MYCEVYLLDAPYHIDRPFDYFTELELQTGQLVRVPFGRANHLRLAIVVKLKEESESELGGKTVGGYVRAPYQAENAHGGFYFYAQHLTEMICEIFGRFPLSVTARRNGAQIHVLFHYDDYDCVGLFCDRNYTYYVSRMSETGCSSFDVPATNEWFNREFEEFYKLLSGGEQRVSHKEFISPVFIMNAICRSLESGKEETIEYEE